MAVCLCLKHLPPSLQILPTAGVPHDSHRCVIHFLWWWRHGWGQQPEMLSDSETKNLFVSPYVLSLQLMETQIFKSLIQAWVYIQTFSALDHETLECCTLGDFQPVTVLVQPLLGGRIVNDFYLGISKGLVSNKGKTIYLGYFYEQQKEQPINMYISIGPHSDEIK